MEKIQTISRREIDLGALSGRMLEKVLANPGTTIVRWMTEESGTRQDGSPCTIEVFNEATVEDCVLHHRRHRGAGFIGVRDSWHLSEFLHANRGPELQVFQVLSVANSDMVRCTISAEASTSGARETWDRDKCAPIQFMAGKLYLSGCEHWEDCDAAPNWDAADACGAVFRVHPAYRDRAASADGLNADALSAWSSDKTVDIESTPRLAYMRGYPLWRLCLTPGWYPDYVYRIVDKTQEGREERSVAERLDKVGEELAALREKVGGLCVNAASVDASATEYWECKEDVPSRVAIMRYIAPMSGKSFYIRLDTGGIQLVDYESDMPDYPAFVPWRSIHRLEWWDVTVGTWRRCRKECGK